MHTSAGSWTKSSPAIRLREGIASRTGLKKPSQFRSLGKRSALHVRVSEDGPLKGAYGHYVPDSENMELKVTYMPQVGFAKSRGEPFTWYRIDNIPSKDELTAQGYGPEMVVRTEGIAPEEAQDALVTKGFKAWELWRKSTSTLTDACMLRPS